MTAYCRFDGSRRCFHPNSGCSFVSALGEVFVCQYHPASPSISRGRVFLRLTRDANVNFAVLRGSKYVRLRGV